MGALLGARRRQVRTKGRQMTLTRPKSTLAITLVGFSIPYQPDQLQGGVQQGDLRVEILNDELAAYGAIDRPRTGDRLSDSERTFTLRDAYPVHEGEAVIGWTLWTNGGA